MVTRAARVRLGLLWLATIVYAAGLIIALSGGGVLTPGGVRLSLRSAKNPLTVVLLAVAAAAALAPRGRRWHTLTAEWTAIVAPIESAFVWLVARSRRTAGVIAAALAAAVIALGAFGGAHVAGGSDSYGYVSEARLFAQGRLHVDQPLLLAPPAGLPPEVVIPLGYRMSTDRRTLVPTYAAGYPLLMAAFEWLAGPAAVFLVMPLLAGLAVWCTYLFAGALAGEGMGLIAAALLATHPAFLFALTHPPMSDIPAMGWWIAALAAAARPSSAAALISGLATGAAILTRPNLVPLAVFVGAMQLAHGIRLRHLLLFSIGPIAASLGVAALNDYWYGSPTTSGYGALGGVLYKWEFFWPDLTRYSGWFWESHPWLIVLAAAGVTTLVRRRANLSPAQRPHVAVSAAFAATVCALYAFYLPLADWTSLRMLFPAFPFLCLLAALAVRALPASPIALRVAVVVMVAALGVAASRDRNAFNVEGDRRFAVMGRHLGSLPARAAVLSMHHSGSANFYSGRLTLRWDMLRAEQLDPLVAELEAQGYVPYLLLDDFEEADFIARFRGVSRLGALDWEPMAAMPRVKLWAVTRGARNE